MLFLTFSRSLINYRIYNLNNISQIRYNLSLYLPVLKFNQKIKINSPAATENNQLYFHEPSKSGQKRERVLLFVHLMNSRVFIGPSIWPKCQFRSCCHLPIIMAQILKNTQVDLDYKKLNTNRTATTDTFFKIFSTLYLNKIPNSRCQESCCKLCSTDNKLGKYS